MLLRSPGETLEGSDLLDELAGGPGVLLWRSLRSATLWASVPPRQRRRLFASGARDRWLRDQASVPMPAALRDPLRVLAALLASPSGITADRVARACTQIAEWATGAGAPRTALAFSQAAAVVLPESPTAALGAGLLAEGIGQEIRAETWLRRALVVSRARRDRAAQARASLQLARILARRGEEVRAARMYARTLRLAGTGSLRRVRVEALREMDAMHGRSTAAAGERRITGR